jgi:hypothetical protein
MPRYVIHIGPHKTGSTSLQVTFQRMTKQLRARGVVYPSCWTDPPRSWGHVQLIPRLMQASDSQLTVEFRELNASDARVVLLSAEDLSILDQESVTRLRSLLDGSAVSIVFYCRRWSELLPSAWQEVVKHGESLSFPRFVASNIANLFGSLDLNYSARLDKYANTFGIENIHIVSYNNIVDNGGDLTVHFLKTFLEWLDPPEVKPAWLNRSLDPKDAELIRALNSFEWARTGRRSLAISMKVQRLKSQFDLALLNAAMEAAMENIYMNEGDESFIGLHYRLFEKYCGRLVPPLSSHWFFQPKHTRMVYVDQQYLLAPGAIEALRTIDTRIAESVLLRSRNP